jgi:hypothetical protein
VEGEKIESADGSCLTDEAEYGRAYLVGLTRIIDTDGKKIQAQLIISFSELKSPVKCIANMLSAYSSSQKASGSR